MPAPEIINKLVLRFQEHFAALHSPQYNEAQLRLEYLDPFFEALGWDVYNKKEYSLNYREVVSEDSIHIKGSPNAKAPDYAFRLGGNRKFFVEAKKPAEDIQNTKEFAFQLKSYAWSLGLPLSILTDFEEFAVYDCRNKPNASDSPATSRIFYMKFTEYLERWDEIAGIFSPQAIQRGAFDKFAQDNTAKKGTTEVDDAFLADIETWRESLARNIALRNSELINERRLNFAVQMTIDRIIFLRICEDRGIEPGNQLFDISHQKDIYSHLINLFQRADLKYNSGLFHFKVEKGNGNQADTFTPTLSIDDKVLKDIIRNLYYPCPYVFKEIPVEILGQVYEQFLGKVIRLTPGKQARIEEKLEVRKAGGVYYTPKYIVDYIVANTVGKLLEGKTTAEASKLKIVDPACGSGSFLLGAFQYLMDWHEKWYLENDLEKWTRGKSPAMVYTEIGDLRLTTAEKKRILINNIYGVDIDAQAVEVTKLSLLLKVLEEETGQLALGFDRVLPDLGENIKCGNSLIGWDYFQGQLLADDEEILRVNPFNWENNFADVFAQGGFNAVIGNPPYIRIQSIREWAPKDVEYYRKIYYSAKSGNFDIYVIFVEKGLSLLCENGIQGFILPSKFFSTDYGLHLRELITKGNSLQRVIDFGSIQIFDQATTYTNLLFLSRKPQSTYFYSKVLDENNLTELIFSENKQFDRGEPWLFLRIEERNIHEKLTNRSVKLGDLPARIARGSSSGNDKIFIKKIIQIDPVGHSALGEEIGPYRIPLYSTDFGRYKFFPKQDELIVFPYKVFSGGYDLITEEELRRVFPYTFSYLFSNKKELVKRKQFKTWYSFSAPRNLDIHDNANILVPLLANKGSFCKFESNQRYCLMASGGFSITIDKQANLNPDYVLGLLNSKLLFWKLKAISNVFRGGWITCTKQYVETLPIHTVDFSDPIEIKHYEKMVDLVKRIQDLHRQKPMTPREQDLVKQQIETTDAEINRLVYELYDLTDEEIKIVESTG